MELPDVQSERPLKGFKLTRVGISGVKKSVLIKRPGRDVNLIAEFSVSVNLPSTLKGSHLSRNIEAICEVVDSSVRDPAPSLEGLAVRIARELLRRHDYATFAEVNIAADYFLNRGTPDGRSSQERYGLFARARLQQEGGGRKMIGVEVVGMSTCPCAQEGIRALLKRELEEGKAPKEVMERLLELPVPTHNQRNRAYLSIETDLGQEVEADELIEIAEESFSSPTYEFLKRMGEARMVLGAHRNPRFVEDVVREMLRRVLERYPHLPGDTVVCAKSISEESIHKHDAFAERLTTLEELRR
ncbi:MAG: GTP cyclohydrolase I FolE2 [Thermoplasmata archaeon]|nr:MAG: GTP cyclohydrolase I FolE2 [Thermoplasmata archaeon]RLF69211.1 MAG: GTP cyclohydrolase I FolE2 [Thermoplasmata archaeon]RLF73983.1 MAG: GTP cyclohydrolase I FolE2 [Thermoplasmata archaeon]RLF74250.1 MAG: GTP cyclohydrolase I FolE2 [Thermoplasmata archaeon]